MLKQLSDYLGQIVDLPPRLDVLRRAGLLDPTRPDEGIRSILAVRRLGPIAGAAHIAARRDPHALAVVDELGPLTFGELDQRSNALARAWAEHGLGPDAVIAVLCRDHRWLVDCMLASAKLGARLLLMNTGFSRPQLADVAEREGVSALTYDQEFTELLGAVRSDIPRYLAWSDTPAETGPDIVKLADLIAS
ncbi:MAG TPA: AMP-binding protein, partial [Pseudonocardiaceae bacterium]|nr:AMP-binding protein [Pseudonocardiaceae bacterium]